MTQISYKIKCIVRIKYSLLKQTTIKLSVILTFYKISITFFFLLDKVKYCICGLFPSMQSRLCFIYKKSKSISQTLVLDVLFIRH